MTTTANGLDDLKALAGTELDPSPWREITQERVNTFADAANDHQWIHTDPERAKEGPFGGTVAHGYLTLSLLIPMYSEVLEINGLSMNVNYGLDKLRFPAPVPVGAKIRLLTKVDSVEEIADGGGVEVRLAFTVEIEGSGKPACVAQAIYRHYA